LRRPAFLATEPQRHTREAEGASGARIVKSVSLLGDLQGGRQEPKGELPPPLAGKGKEGACFVKGAEGACITLDKVCYFADSKIPQAQFVFCRMTAKPCYMVRQKKQAGRVRTCYREPPA